jgi:hypothetical protein
MRIKIPVSIGELFDKVSILSIKFFKLKDDKQKAIVHKEFKLLHKELLKVDALYFKTQLFRRLKNVNRDLWNIEDGKRQCEALQTFDEHFIMLSREVYIKNDLRAKLKSSINKKYKSEIVEIKSYKKY